MTIVYSRKDIFYKGFAIISLVRFWAVPQGEHPGDSGRQWNSEGGASKTQGKPMVFEGTPRGIRLRSRGPLRAGKGLVQDLTIKMFIFTMFLKGFVIIVRF